MIRINYCISIFKDCGWQESQKVVEWRSIKQGKKPFLEKNLRLHLQLLQNLKASFLKVFLPNSCYQVLSLVIKYLVFCTPSCSLAHILKMHQFYIFLWFHQISVWWQNGGSFFLYIIFPKLLCLLVDTHWQQTPFWYAASSQTPIIPCNI